MKECVLALYTGLLEPPCILHHISCPLLVFHCSFLLLLALYLSAGFPFHFSSCSQIMGLKPDWNVLLNSLNHFFYFVLKYILFCISWLKLVHQYIITLIPILGGFITTMFILNYIDDIIIYLENGIMTRGNLLRFGLKTRLQNAWEDWR